MKLAILLMLAMVPIFPVPAETHNSSEFNLPFSAPELTVDSESEEVMLALVNEEREKAGLEPLVIDESLVAVARLHSFDMWEKEYFAHESPDGKTPFDRLVDGGVGFHKAGENLALSRDVQRAHKGLMESEGHRKNILEPDFKRVGIGVVDGGIYGKMWTQNFAD